VRQNPDVPFLIAGDQRVDYGRIYQAMVLLQQAGVAKVGLMSQPQQQGAQ
jgi:biopolymer transport protein TolR